MTATDLPHIRSLLAALDAGDDSVLSVLADALEEGGDPRAAGLRLLAGQQFRPAGGPVWYSYGRGGTPVGAGGQVFVRANHDLQGEGRHALPLATFARLRGGSRPRKYARVYPSRGEAFLALAAALTGA